MKHMNKLLGALGLFLVVYSLIIGGFDLGHHNYQEAVPNLVVAAFWILFLVIIAIEAVHDASFKAEMKFLEKTSAMLKGLAEAEEAKQAKHEALHAEIEHDIDLAGAIAQDIMKGEKREVTPEETARIEQAFHDQSDGKFLKIHNSSDEGMEMEISAEPFEQVPGRSDAHEAARVRGDEARAKQIPVTDGEAAPKPLTKSQQRRINNQKGFGPITDDEVRDQKNAKRRAARLAKKEALEQTKLI